MQWGIGSQRKNFLWSNPWQIWMQKATIPRKHLSFFPLGYLIWLSFHAWSQLALENLLSVKSAFPHGMRSWCYRNTSPFESLEGLKWLFGFLELSASSIWSQNSQNPVLLGIRLVLQPHCWDGCQKHWENSQKERWKLIVPSGHTYGAFWVLMPAGTRFVCESNFSNCISFPCLPRSHSILFPLIIALWLPRLSIPWGRGLY